MQTEISSGGGPVQDRPEKMAEQSFLSRLRIDLPWLALILIANGSLFFAEIFMRRSLSRMSRLAEWDSVFQHYAGGPGGSCDPSLAQLLVPNYFLVAKLWHSGQLPLWNPYCGTGVPLVGDIQATVFSPLHFILALFPDARTYNLILVGEAFLACLGVYCLARLLTLSAPASFFAALAYGWTPYILAYLELLSGTSHALLPLLAAAFVWAARRPSSLSRAIASLAAASYVLSGHPESSFFGVVAAVVLFFLVRRVLPCCRGNFWDIALIGLPALGLAAPVLLPFAEYVSVGDSYKYGVGASAFAPWQSLAFNLVAPVNGITSPYCGALIAPMLIFAPIAERRRRGLILGLMAGTVLSFAAISLIWPFSWLVEVRPFSYLVTVYLIPVYLLSLVLSAAIGLDSFFDVLKSGRFAMPFALLSLFLVTVSAVMAVLYLSAFDFSICNFDQTQPAAAINAPITVLYLALAMILPAIMALAFFFRRGERRIAACSFIVYAAIFLNCVSLFIGARAALPIEPKFDYPRAEIIDFLLSHPGRVLSVNEHVLKPNANCVYGISSLRVHNPILPAHFCDLAKLCGANIDEFRNQSYSAGVKNFIDLLSVRYLLGQFTPLDSDPRYKKVFQSSEAIAVYENTRALPEAYLSRSCHLAAGDQEALTWLSEAAPETKPLVVEAFNSRPDFEALSLTEPGQITSARVSRPSASEVLIETEAPFPSVCVLTDTFYPGWRAEVDGKITTISRANLLFRAVPLAAGKHLVRFSYMPLSFVWGVVLAALSLISLVALLVLDINRRLKR